MTAYSSTRRKFLKTAGVGLLALGLLSSAWSQSDSSSTGSSFMFVQLCDPQLGMGGYEQDLQSFEKAVRQINLLNPAFVVICGDLVQHANEQSFADFNRIKAELQVPCYCVAGNHDVGNVPTAESLENYRQKIGADTYSFEHGPFTFVGVNTQFWTLESEESDRQAAWLEQTLATAAEKKSPVIVIGHYPLFLKTADEADQYFNIPFVQRQKILALFEKYGVVAMLGGHTHKLIMNEYKGIQLVNGETTSKNFDDRPFGYRVWTVTDSRPIQHEFIPLEGL
ncbi:MAG: twin-arginine translocation signal domain-containing protein [Kiritimatiellaceae bacterium]|nr:twin-arginine translocation signal domain-containing protein [Kiritimatiellaceae bacterium]